MDHHHARHPLSSPSPTSSPFLFHHSERHPSFSSNSNSTSKPNNPLTPLLSSTAADGGVDDCFPSPTPTSHHNGNNNPHSPFDSVVDTRSQSPPQLINHHNHNHLQNHNQHNGNSHHHHSNGNSHLHNHHNHNHHLHHHHHHHHSDSLTGVEDDDDDDGMHNMLSGGSSSSSTSTMPLLTESHSHHSFSRISLEEYSPLSLVEDCDNALPISPTSLACGSLTHHHSPFKTSLNGLNKIGDNLVSEIVHSDVDHDDARSLSPSLLSSTSAHHHHNHHHQQHHHGHHNGHHHHHHHHSSSGHGGNSNSNVLWSNSSTAITQNTSILNSHSTTTSFLLNQHHQQQLNSLMQQLEPQSLDEPPQPPPCLLTNNSNSSSDHFDGPSSSSAINNNINNDNNNIINNSFLLGPLELGESGPLVAHRPSSEPPPSCGTDSLISDLECKSLNGQQASTTSNKQANKRKNHEKQSKKANSDTSNTAASSVQSTPTRPRRNRSKASAAAVAAAAAAAKQAELNKKTEIEKEQAHSSKVHLQLNHHKKLQELQRRLFGTVETAESVVVVASKSEPNKPDDQAIPPKPSTSSECIKVKQEPDSSAAGGKDESAGQVQQHQSDANKNKTEPIARSRPSRARRSRAKSSVAAAKVQEEKASAQKVVPTEKVEPDTTTRSSSDCTKLADLLSNTSSSMTTVTKNIRGQKNDSSFSNNNITPSAIQTESVATSGSASEAVAVSATSDPISNEKRTVQTIQVQMSPSLTAVMAANATGLIQPITIQQQPHDNGSASGLLAGNGTLAANQIFCRTTAGGAGTAQLKGILSSNELLKSGGSATAHQNENMMTTWTLQPANPNNNNNGNGNSGPANQHQATIGAHQIAIQVICQDGTSLVLPVSSATGLNAAVSLTSQHQQLQAVLANNAAIAFNQQQQRNNMPPISVANIVAQQQTSGIDSSSTITTAANSSQASANSSGHASSGLAASSPTLAALLDAGSSNRSGAMNSDGGANFVSNNLLRKLVSGGLAPQKVHIKRGDQLLQAATDVTFTTVNGGSLVISNPVSAQAQLSTQQESNKQKNQASTFSEKRIKLSSNENADTGPVNVQATFTLVDPQSLIITGELDRSTKQANQLVQQTTSGSCSNQQQASAIVKAANSDTWKQTKMGSSTGNRQVDPTQPFRCEHCNSTFTRLGNFTRHKKIHTVPTKDGQRFKCDVCSKSFLQRCDLARHLHIHRGTEPHRCNICGKGYIRHSDLVTHQRFHNKEKPFGCPQCSKGFCQRGDLNRHLRSIHLQMKPILCPCCNRKFAKQETLLRHLNTAHRSKPGTTTTAANTAVIAKLSPNHSSLTQGDDKQRQQQQAPAITVVTNAVALNNNNDNNIQKNAAVASLQAIQATLCNIPQSVDPSTMTTSTNISTSPNATTEQQQATNQTAKA